jgi:2-oxoglutarate ferredoxin oxidoreductase subunit beta
MHVLRRNVDINLLLFNNRIYGLTKGQYSPTSESGKVTKSTPMGSADFPLEPVSFALGANATFVARSIDVDAKHLASVLKRAAGHTGTSFVEIYQNCNVFNDGAFDAFREKATAVEHQLQLEHGQKMVFGPDQSKGLRFDSARFALEVVAVGPNGPGNDILVHDENNLTLATMLARMPFPEFPVALGVLYRRDQETLDARLGQQAAAALEKSGPGDLDALLRSGETWTA